MTAIANNNPKLITFPFVLYSHYTIIIGKVKGNLEIKYKKTKNTFGTKIAGGPQFFLSTVVSHDDAGK